MLLDLVGGLTVHRVVAADRVLLFVDDVDVTQVATVLPASITYDPLLPLAAGVHSVTLVVAEEQKKWSFTIVPAAGASANPRTGVRGDWVITPVGTITLVREAENQMRAAFSSQTDLADGAYSSKSTVDRRVPFSSLRVSAPTPNLRSSGSASSATSPS